MGRAHAEERDAQRGDLVITGKIESKYGVRVLAWEPQPGQPLPLPRLEDDREEFPVEVVKSVLAWLGSRKAEFVRDPTPTPIHITMGQTIGREGQTPTRLRVHYGKPGDPAENMHFANFTASTIEVVLRTKKAAPITATFHYLAARDELGRAIVGPYLRHVQKQEIILAAACR